MKILDILSIATQLSPLIQSIEGLFGSKADPVSPIVDRLNPDNVHFVGRLLGLAFGPEGMTHFSELTSIEQDAMLRRAPVLKTNHSDWPKPLRWVPRTATCWTVPAKWPILAGNTTSEKPIPERGEWYVKRGYLAWTSEDGWHIRMGFRLDDVDGYVTFPSFTIKRVG